MTQIAVNHEHLLYLDIGSRARLHFAIRHILHQRADNPHLRVLIQKGDFLFQTCGVGKIVVIHDGEIFALRHVDQTIARTRYAEIPFVHGIDDARVIIRLHHFFHLRIGGTVVQNKKLEIRKRLRKNTVHRLTQMFGSCIIHGHEYGNTGHSQFLPVLLRYHTEISHTRKAS